MDTVSYTYVRVITVTGDARRYTRLIILKRTSRRVEDWGRVGGGGGGEVSASGHTRPAACKCDHTLRAHYTADLLGLNTRNSRHADRTRNARFPGSNGRITCRGATNAYKLIMQSVSLSLSPADLLAAKFQVDSTHGEFDRILEFDFYKVYK